MRALVLFTRDLRVRDHPGLAAACAEADQVVPLFVLDPSLLRTSANRTRFLMESLLDLDRSLQRLGGGLVLRRGDVAAHTVALARSTGCSVIHLTADATAVAIRRQEELSRACGCSGIELRLHPGNAVVEPGAVAPDGRAGYRVFTPYFRAWAQAPRREVLPAPSRLQLPEGLDPGSRPDPSRVRGTSPDLPEGGERAARRRLHRFVGSELEDYPDGRGELGTDRTSRLSPYLRSGCISASELASRAADRPGAEAFLRQLAWRDFFAQLLAQDPTLAWRDLRPRGDGTPPSGWAEEAMEAWRVGRTGIPLVDAAMRQLLREGWIHNRGRMVAASFLTRHLAIAWQEGARYFGRWLVDGEPANNTGNWQWVAGTGADPRRTRTLNPVRQARRYDPTGTYLRRHVRELADVEPPRIFAPWTDPALLRRTGYPPPIVAVRR